MMACACGRSFANMQFVKQLREDLREMCTNKNKNKSNQGNVFANRMLNNFSWQMASYLEEFVVTSSYGELSVGMSIPIRHRSLSSVIPKK